MTVSVRVRPIADGLVLVGALLIPFENLVIAPSQGWAAIAPIAFFAAAVLYLIERRAIPTVAWGTILFVGTVLTLGTWMWIRTPPVPSIVLDKVIAVTLGLATLLALTSYLRSPGSEGFLRRFRALASSLAWGYALAILYGLAYIAAHELAVAPLIDVFQALAKRYYGTRYSLTFTEPSFASMHLWGVVFPALVASVRLRDRRSTRRLALVHVALSIMGLIWIDSLRFVIDYAVVLSLVGIVLLGRSWLGRVFAPAFLIAIAAIAIVVGPALHPRMSLLVDAIANDPTSLAYADASFASRYFRLDAISEGLRRDPIGLTLGFGFANTHVPFAMGYDAAVARYDNAYTKEVDALARGPQASYFSLPFELAAWIGVFGLAVVLLLYWRYTLFVMAAPVTYLYFQFDSLTFYAIWLTLALSYAVRRRESVAPRRWAASWIGDAESR